MARSILPSKRSVRDERQAIHRAERREAKQQLAHEASLLPNRDLRQRELGFLVSRRRGRDKLRHFERWAIAITRELPRDQRLDALRSLLPGGLIGEHALLHLRHRPELMEPRPHLPWLHRRPTRPRPHRYDFGDLAQRLRRVLNGGEVRALHRALKHAAVDGAQQVFAFRPLEGVHDVKPFLRWLAVTPAALEVVEAFCAGPSRKEPSKI